MLYRAEAALDRQKDLPQWARDRFEHVRHIALCEQIHSRVGPGEAFRKLVSWPFALVANTVRGTNSEDLAARLAVQNNIRIQFDNLARPLGIEGPPELNVPSIGIDNSKYRNAALARRIAGRVRVIQTTIEQARRTADALKGLEATDKEALRQIAIPAG